MNNVHNIEDKMALACQCGCVRFNLLKSGAIECDGCQIKQQHLIWIQLMDTNYKPKTVALEPSSEQVQKARLVIKSAIEKNQSCYWGNIVKENNDRLPLAALNKASSQMQKEKIIRLREDDLEHDWEYVFR